MRRPWFDHADRTAPRPVHPIGLILLAGVLIGSALLTSQVWAGGAEDPASLSGPPGLTSKAPLNGPPGAPVPAVLFPADASGYPGEIRDPRDTAPYLAWHKAEAMRRAQQTGGTREEPVPAESYYDARYYSLDLDLNPTTRILTGTVTMRATVTAGPLTQLVLDLENNMAVSSVTSGSVAATYSHASRLLTVNLDRAYNNGEDVTLVIQYSGNPSGGSFGWETVAGRPMIWTLSEAFGARDWWPCKDYPEDKADSVDVRVTVPTGMITASNGVLRQQYDNGTEAFTWWHEKHPITTYLVSLAIYPYTVYSDWYHPARGDSMEIRFYNFPSSLPDVLPVQAKVKDMMGVFAGEFGEYPFLDEKYGHAEFTWGGGMEHQTCTSLGYFGESVVAHELSHQWWGDMITCESFHHIWLNEGFATYCEALWAESQFGWPAYQEEMAFSEYYGPGTIYVPDTSDWNRIFDSNLSYNKASWILHMLRGIVGDADFFQILRTYYTQYKYSVATTEDFQAVAEAVSGKNLSAFFQEWVYGEYYPIYTYTWSAAGAGGGWDVTLNLQQAQSWQIFTMPIQITVSTEGGDQSFLIENTQASQTFTLHTDSRPTDLALDKDHWILRVVLAPIPTPTFAKSLLLVNGVSWDTYGNEIRSAYQDKSFSGVYPIDFWDCFPQPGGGYPSILPAPLGHGAVPGDILGQYKTIIWVGNNFGGDLGAWNDTPVLSYLEAGGNVFLMTRMADSYMIEPYRNYLGINWVGNGTVYDCIATYNGLTNIARLGTQNAVAGFSPTGLGPESTLLYKAVSGHVPNWGLGVVREPAGGGTYNPDGGRFAFLSGRPYRWNHTDLRTNVEFILSHFLGLPPVTGTQEGSTATRLTLSSGWPNPFNSQTRLRFSLPADDAVRLDVWDVGGRRVRSLLNGPATAGQHEVHWDGRDAAGRSVASGIYYLRLETGGQTLENRILRLR